MDFAPARAVAAPVTGSPQEAAYRWIRANVGPADVVLADPLDAALMVVTGGRRTVATFNAFSSPYVALERREAAMQRMFAALDRGDAAAFYGAAGPYDVRWVLTSGRRSARYAAQTPAPLREAFAVGTYRVYRVRRSH